MPSSMVSGLRPRLADRAGGVLGADVAELLAALHADQEVRRARGLAALDRVVAGEVTLAVVAVDPARLAAGPRRQAQQRHRRRTARRRRGSRPGRREPGAESLRPRVARPRIAAVRPARGTRARSCPASAGVAERDETGRPAAGTWEWRTSCGRAARSSNAPRRPRSSRGSRLDGDALLDQAVHVLDAPGGQGLAGVGAGLRTRRQAERWPAYGRSAERAPAGGRPRARRTPRGPPCAGAPSPR